MSFGKHAGKHAGKENKKEKNTRKLKVEKEYQTIYDEEELPKAMRQQESKKKTKSKKRKVLKIILIIFVLLIIAVMIWVGIFIALKLGKINYKNLDENDLAINHDLYNEVNGVSKSDYDQVTNILFLGSDSRDLSDTYSGYSDAIIILSINPKYKSVKLISIPRDTAVNIEGLDYRYKINNAFKMGKEQLAVKTVNQAFDLNIKEYITLNIEGIYEIINELGGLELDITQEEMKYINQYIDIFYNLSGEKVKRVTKYGKVTLTGEQVAAHVKERMAGDRDKSETHGDYGRTKRQREVIQALLNKIASKDASEVSRISDMILEQITTNIDAGKITSLLLEFITNKDAYSKNVQSVMLPGLDYSEEILEKGSYLYVTNDIDRAKKEFIHYMYEV